MASSAQRPGSRPQRGLAHRLRNRLLAERQAVLASTEVRSLARPDVTSICTDIVREIDGALDRMADGSYGYCTLCGRPIPAARLRALPYAAECVACKRQVELETAAVAR